MDVLEGIDTEVIISHLEACGYEVKEIEAESDSEELTEVVFKEGSAQQNITYTQAYDISTRVSADVDSKGMIKPSARVEISRRLESGDQITELIHADIERGVEEVMAGIEGIRKKVGVE